MVKVKVDIQKNIIAKAVVRKRITASAVLLNSVKWLTDCPLITSIDGGDLGLGNSQYPPVNGVLNGGSL